MRDAARDAARAEMLGIPTLVAQTTTTTTTTTQSSSQTQQRGQQFQGEGIDSPMTLPSPATELFVTASARVQSAAWAGRPVSETFVSGVGVVGGGGFQAGVMDGGGRRWGGRG